MYIIVINIIIAPSSAVISDIVSNKLESFSFFKTDVISESIFVIKTQK